jgi:hypothetical protein
MGLLFLETDVAYEICVGDFSILRDVRFGNEEKCAGSSNSFGKGAFLPNAVFKKSAPFIGEAVLPGAGVWTAEELA